jgi:hypothetical protein
LEFADDSADANCVGSGGCVEKKDFSAASRLTGCRDPIDADADRKFGTRKFGSHFSKESQ